MRKGGKKKTKPSRKKRNLRRKKQRSQEFCVKFQKYISKPFLYNLTKKNHYDSHNNHYDVVCNAEHLPFLREYQFSAIT